MDPSSGAALATRDLLALLARRGWDCRVLCGPHLDFEGQTFSDQLLKEQGIPFTARTSQLGELAFAVLHARPGGVPLAIYGPAVTDRYDPPPAEGLPFLALLEQTLEQFRPELMLTYGGHRLAREAIA